MCVQYDYVNMLSYDRMEKLKLSVKNYIDRKKIQRFRMRLVSQLKLILFCLLFTLLCWC